MDVALWVSTLFLVAVFAFAGGVKATRPKERLLADMPDNMAWVDDFSPSTIRSVGILEVLAAGTLLVTLVLDAAPLLAVAASCGLAITMLLAAAVHARRGEGRLVAMPLVLGALCAFTAAVHAMA